MNFCFNHVTIWQKPRQTWTRINPTCCVVFPGFCRTVARMIHKKEPNRKILTSLCLLSVLPSVHSLQVDLSVHFSTFGSSIRSICGFYSLLFIYSIIHLLSHFLGFNHPSCSLCLSVHLTRHSVMSLLFLTSEKLSVFYTTAYCWFNCWLLPALLFSPPVCVLWPFFPYFVKTIHFSVIST